MMIKTLSLLAVLAISHSAHANSISGRIVGGIEVNSGAHPLPSIVAVLVENASGQGSCGSTGGNCSQQCGGVYLGGQWVVSAAHCFQGSSSNGLYVRGNSLNWAQGGNSARVSEVIIHPDFSELQINGTGSGQFFNDIALLRLNGTLNNTPIGQLSSCDVEANTLSYAVGWGAQSVQRTATGGVAGDNFPTFLRTVDLPTAEFDTCDEGLYEGILQDSQHLCAGSIMGGKDSCFGDSGGPLVQEIDGQGTVVGLTSFGSVFCGSFGNVGVYTRLGEYIDWIELNSTIQVQNNNGRCDAPTYDSDGDFVPDFIELRDGTNDRDAENFIDSDSDGVPAYIEGLHQTSDFSPTSFLDTNENDVPDYIEVINDSENAIPNPNNTSSGRGDGGVLDFWGLAALLGLLLNRQSGSTARPTKR